MKPDCTTTALYESMEACPGQKSLPGIRRRLYYVPKADITLFPTLPEVTGASGQKMEELAKLTGNFTLDTGKYFKFIDLKDEASNVTFETVGENGSKLFNNQATAIVAGMSDEVKGFARQVKNDDLVYVFQDRAGKFCVIGNEMFSTHTDPSGDTAAEATAATTATFSIQCYDECPVPTYEGELSLSETDYVDCADGKVKKRNA